jgi:tetratricopeptide (TPR) repeat protein
MPTNQAKLRPDSEAVPAEQALADLDARASQAMADKDYRRAAAYHLEAAEICNMVLKQMNEPDEKAHWEGHVHLQAARHVAAFYLDEKRSDAPMGKLEGLLSDQMKEARAAIEHFREPQNLALAYELLLDAYTRLVDLRSSRNDIQGALAAFKEQDECANEFRKRVPDRIDKPYWFRLYSGRANVSLLRGFLNAFEHSDILTARNCFKMAEFEFKRATEHLDSPEREKAWAVFASIVRGHTEFAEGMVLAQRGLYREAASRFGRASGEFLKCGKEEVLFLAKLTRANQYSSLGASDELEGEHERAIKRYESAKKGFTESAALLPAEHALTPQLRSTLTFLADSMRDRQEAARSRPDARQRLLRRGMRNAGILFFCLWLVGIAATAIACRALYPDLSFFGFFLALVLAFVAAALGAALIKAKEALAFLQQLVATVTKSHPESKPKAKEE